MKLRKWLDTLATLNEALRPLWDCAGLLAIVLGLVFALHGDPLTAAIQLTAAYFIFR